MIDEHLRQNPVSSFHHAMRNKGAQPFCIKTILDFRLTRYASPSIRMHPLKGVSLPSFRQRISSGVNIAS